MNSWQHRLLWISLITLFVGIPLSKALSSIGVGLLCLSALFLGLQNGFPKLEKRFMPLLGLSVLIIFYLISCTYSSSISEGLDEVFRQHAFLSIPLSFLVLRNWIQPRLPQLIHFFIGACTFHCLVTIGLFVLPESIVTEIVDQIPLLQPYPELTDRLKFGLCTPFLERLNLAYLIGFAILFLLYEGMQSGWRWQATIQTIILVITFVLIGARGAQLAFLFAFGIGGLSYVVNWIKSLNLPPEEYRQRLTSAITILIIGIFVTPYIAYKTVPAVKKRYDQMQWELRLIENGDYKKEAYQYFTSLTRIRAWQNAITVIKNNPILGVGIGDYNTSLEAANHKYNDRVPVHNQNFFLYVWGASGILALVAFLIGIWRYTRSFWIHQLNPIRHLALAYICFIIISCLIDAFLKYHIGSISVTLFLSSMFLLNLPIRTSED